MANGRQLSRENFETFLVWMASKSDQDFQSLESRGVLSRTKVSRECGFSKSSLDQNPHIKKALRTLESELRDRGVLPSLVKRS
uniref:VPA1267 family protein n=1 Tax=Variovorax sp. dw_308 TaxID=2721546 RepID=UPI00352722D9